MKWSEMSDNEKRVMMAQVLEWHLAVPDEYLLVNDDGTTTMGRCRSCGIREDNKHADNCPELEHHRWWIDSQGESMRPERKWKPWQEMISAMLVFYKMRKDGAVVFIKGKGDEWRVSVWPNSNETKRVIHSNDLREAICHAACLALKLVEE